MKTKVVVYRLFINNKIQKTETLKFFYKQKVALKQKQ